jgi:hypothetical protein
MGSLWRRWTEIRFAPRDRIYVLSTRGQLEASAQFTHFSPEPLDGQVGNMAGSFGPGLSLQATNGLERSITFAR